MNWLAIFFGAMLLLVLASGYLAWHPEVIWTDGPFSPRDELIRMNGG